MTAIHSPSLRLRPALRNLAAEAKAEVKASRLPWPVVIYLLTIVVPILFSAGSLSMNTQRLFLIIIIVPLMIRLFTGKYGRVYLTDYLFVAHIGWATVALYVNSPDQVLTQFGSVGAEFLGGYALGRAYIRTREQFIALCKFLAFLVLCLLPFTLYESQTARSILLETLNKLPGVRSIGTFYIEGRLGMERVQSVFTHPIHFGLFCSVAFSLSFVALKGITSDAWRWISSILIGLSGFLALSSGALLAICLQVGLILWATIFAGFKHRWWLLFGLFALAYIVVDMISNRSAIMVFLSYATFSSHNAYWRAQIFEWGMKNVWANPIFGLGLRDWVRPFYMYSGSMDNFWLVMGVRYGWPGFLLLAIGYVRAIYLIMRRNFEGDERLTLIRRAWVFTFIGLSFTISTVHVWTHIYSFVFFMFGAGMWLITVSAGEGAKPASQGSGRGGNLPRQQSRQQSGARGPAAPVSASESAPVSAPVSAPPPATEPADPAGLRRGPRYSRFSPVGGRQPRRPLS